MKIAMNRYLLFSFDVYYPEGGVNDFKGSYATMVEAMQADVPDYQLWNVLDTQSGRVFDSHEVNHNERLKWAAGIDNRMGKKE